MGSCKSIGGLAAAQPAAFGVPAVAPVAALAISDNRWRRASHHVPKDEG
jgi:hypothetical protein